MRAVSISVNVQYDMLRSAAEGSKSVAAIECYLDKSGDVDEPVIIVAGYVASKQQWIELSRKWVRILKSANISDFHMADLTKADRDKLVPIVAPIIRPYVRCIIAAGVPVSDFRCADIGTARKMIGTAYQYCCFHCMRMVTDWARKSPQREPVAFFFDRDGKFTNETTWLYQAVVNRFPSLRERHKIGNLAFGDREHLVPLQVADMLAYELFIYRRALLKNPAHQVGMCLEKLLSGFKQGQRLDFFHRRKQIEQSALQLKAIATRLEIALGNRRST